MTHDTEALKGLLAKVEAATGPDHLIDIYLVCALIAPPKAFIKTNKVDAAPAIHFGFKENGDSALWSQWLVWAKFHPTASIDAALALVERVLPASKSFVAGSPPSSGWKLNFYRGMTPTDAPYAHWQVNIRPHAQDGWDGDGPTLSLAILGSLLKALIAISAPAALAQGGPHEA